MQPYALLFNCTSRTVNVCVCVCARARARMRVQVCVKGLSGKIGKGENSSFGHQESYSALAICVQCHPENFRL